MRPWIVYTLVRVGFFAAVFAILMLLGVPWWLSAIFAAVIGLCVAYIFFGKLRDAVARDIVERRARAHADADTAAEDDAPEDATDNSAAEDTERR